MKTPRRTRALGLLVTLLSVCWLALPAQAGERFCWTNDNGTDVDVKSLTVYDSNPPSADPKKRQSLISSTIPEQTLKVKKGDTVYWPTNFEVVVVKMRFGVGVSTIHAVGNKSGPQKGVGFLGADGEPLLTLLLEEVERDVRRVRQGQKLWVRDGRPVRIPGAEVLTADGQPFTGWAEVAVLFEAGALPAEDARSEDAAP